MTTFPDRRATTAAALAWGLALLLATLVGCAVPQAALAFEESARSGERDSLSPENLRSAYNLPSEGGYGRTIAIVDPANDPNANEDLAVYRKRYSLPACTEQSGCFTKVNERGETGNYPKNGGAQPHDGSVPEISLDLDMASATCPKCHILLVEANTEGTTGSAAIPVMGAAEDEAVELGATVISNSWNYGTEQQVRKEGQNELSLDQYFNHPGVPIFFASGDFGYGVEYPAASRYVTAVGGTKLTKLEGNPESGGSRKWTEEVWNEGTNEGTEGTGSGCSEYEQAPEWQEELFQKWQKEALPNHIACEIVNSEGREVYARVDNDVAAVASEESPVSVYDSYGEVEGGPWLRGPGTSTATPIVAGVDAISSEYAISLGAKAFYVDAGGLFDVTEGSNVTKGSNSTCLEDEEYLCHAEVGYDGPTGNGTPDGPLELEGVPAMAPRPSAWTGFATGVNKGEAVLHGTVNPQGSETTYRFEYGTSTSYGTSVPVSGASAGTSGLEEDREEKEVIAGLQPDTAYHYRLIASNAGGTVYGVDRTFQTSTWAQSSTRSPAGVKKSGISGVSCSSAGACMSVGEYEDGEGVHMTLAESSAGGGKWRVLEMPSVAGARESHLYGVSCHTAEACVAVGGYVNGEGKSLALAESWNGTEWSVTKAPPSPKGAKSSVLRGVSCVAVSACVAVGEYANSEGVELALAESWNGKVWSRESSASWGGEVASSLRGVSCTAAALCTAVGSYKTIGGQELSLVERLNGSEWALQFAANPSSRDYLSGVSCSSSSACTADGWYVNGEGAAGLLVEHWNGSEWQLQSAASPEGAKSGALGGISCSSASACTAVGWYENGANATAALTESWNGGEWKVQSAADPAGASASELQGVSCSSASSCAAAGGYENSEGVPIALAEGWNGSEWQVQSTLNPAEAKRNTISGVSCASASACVSVGEYETSANTIVTLAENWNGSEWLTLPTPDPAGAKEGRLYGVSCTSASVCVAVGGYVQGEGGREKSLAESWNGSEWVETQAPPAPSGARSSVLRSVSCAVASTTVCLAVGEYENEQGAHLALAEKWSSKEWTIQSTPAPREAGEDALRGISCATGKACMAVGFYKNNSGRDLPLAESWNGKQWAVNEGTADTPPTPVGAQNSFLTGVSCTAAEVCVASGYYVDGEGADTAIVENWNENAPSVLTAPAWYIQSLAPAEAKNSVLTGVSCTAVTECTTTGWYETGSSAHVALVERQNGTAYWEPQPISIPAGAASSELLGVSCASQAACVTAGGYENGAGVPFTLADLFS